MRVDVLLSIALSIIAGLGIIILTIFIVVGRARERQFHREMGQMMNKYWQLRQQARDSENEHNN